MNRKNENKEQVIKATYLSILTNTLMAIIKAITGVFGNSFALIADAIESTADVFSSILVLLGIRYSTKPADENHPYGHGKAEPLVTFLIVVFLIISATFIAYKSIINIQTPHESPKSYTLIVLAIVVIIKEVIYRVISKKGQETKSSALNADAWHHRSDAITSFMAFIGISVAIYMGKGYEAADDWAALIAAGIIIFNSYLILRPALSEIMDEHLYDDLIVEIRKNALEVDGVINTEKCFVRKTGITYHVDLHLIVNSQITVKKGHDIAHDVKNFLMNKMPEISNILIHIEPDDEH